MSVSRSRPEYETVTRARRSNQVSACYAEPKPNGFSIENQINNVRSTQTRYRWEPSLAALTSGPMYAHHWATLARYCANIGHADEAALLLLGTVWHWQWLRNQIPTQRDMARTCTVTLINYGTNRKNTICDTKCSISKVRMY